MAAGDHALTTVEDFEARLVALERLPATDRLLAWREELGCLWSLGHHEELVTRCCELESVDPGFAAKTLHWKACAIASAGHPEDAAFFLAAPKGETPDGRDEEACAYARAFVLQEIQPGASAVALRHALKTGDEFLQILEPHLRLSSLREILARRAGFRAMAARSDDALDAILTRVAPAILGVDVEASLRAAPVRWEVNSEVKRAADAAGGCRGWVLAKGGAWIAADAGGLVRLDLTGTPSLHDAFRFDGSAGGVAGAGGFVYVADSSDGLHVIDVSDPANSRSRGLADRLEHEPALGVSVANGVVALAGSHLVELYDLADPAAPIQVGVLGIGSQRKFRVMKVALRAGVCFVALGDGGLLVADVCDPKAPVLLSRLIVENEIDEEESATDLLLLDDVLLVRLSNGAWLVDVRDPRAPVSIAVLPKELRAEAATRIGDNVLILDDDGRVWTIDLSDRKAPRVLHAAVIVDASGARSRTEPRACGFHEGRLLVLGSAGVRVLARAPVAPREDIR